MKKILISFVVPAYKEEKNISLFYTEFLAIWERLEAAYTYEIIFVNDGSTDDTWNEIEKLCEKDSRVKGIDLSRNFGKEIALSAGVEFSKGDCCVTTDVDGQRPLNVIYDFLNEWKNGYKIVYGVRKEMNRGVMRKLASNVFNMIMKKISNIEFESGITDFMLIDKSVVNYFLKYENKNRIFRGIVLSLGFEKSKVYFKEPNRTLGDTRWEFSKLLKLASDTVTSFSVFPLKLIGYLGLIIVFFSIALLIFMFISRFFLGNPYSITNSAFFIISNVFLSGITLSGLGIIAVYIANINDEIIGRPLYLVKDKINFKNK